MAESLEDEDVNDVLADLRRLARRERAQQWALLFRELDDRMMAEDGECPIDWGGDEEDGGEDE